MVWIKNVEVCVISRFVVARELEKTMPSIAHEWTASIEVSALNIRTDQRLTTVLVMGRRTAASGS